MRGARGLIETYLQIGRAHSFLHAVVPAETWFRKMQTLAAAWVAEEPGNHQARDLLASSLRKIADIKKFSKDYAGAQEDYMSAIAIGRDLVNLEPLNLDFKSHLSTALDDVAQVVRGPARLRVGNPALPGSRGTHRRIGGDSDPDHLHYRTACSTRNCTVRTWRATLVGSRRPRKFFEWLLTICTCSSEKAGSSAAESRPSTARRCERSRILRGRPASARRP